MIITIIKDKDIFKTSCEHIVFALNSRGDNKSGFAALVSRDFWPELVDTGPKKLGEILSRKVEGKTFHAIVCYNKSIGGWEETPKIVEKCLNSLDVPVNEAIAIVLMGSGIMEQVERADKSAILDAMARSKKHLVVYT